MQRGISESSYADAMGLYPFFCCHNWDKLNTDFEEIKNDLVCIFMVTDPFGKYDEELLKKCFPSLCSRYKEHYVIDLRETFSSYISGHHKRNAKKAMENIKVEKIDNAYRHFKDWQSLYKNLINRHSIKGVAKFSIVSFEQQFNVPGLVTFRATHNDQTVGMLLFYVQNEIAYYHLGAYSDEGYELNASFALFYDAIKHFSDKNLQWLSLGAGAGIENDGNDGLSRFKKGWSTGTKQTYFCGRIFVQKKYKELLLAKGIFDTGYFPAYRQGEFS